MRVVRHENTTRVCDTHQRLVGMDGSVRTQVHTGSREQAWEREAPEPDVWVTHRTTITHMDECDQAASTWLGDRPVLPHPSTTLAGLMVC